MLESMNFTYDGISCTDMGVVMAIDGGGMMNESLMARRKVITQSIPYRDKPIFKRVELEPLSFPICVYLKEWKDRNNLRAIARWLNQKEPKPLIFESNTDVIYYAIFDGEIPLNHNGLQDGSFKMQLVCDSPYGYSELRSIDVSVNGTNSILLFNDGDEIIQPQLRIRKIGDGDISIKNEANGQELILTDLYDNEVITINGENKEIISSLESSNRFILNQHNDVWLDFEPNYDTDTEFTFTGNFECEFYYEYKYLTQDRPIYFE